MRGRRRAAAVLMLMVLAAGCGGGGGGGAKPPPPGSRQWLAVFETAADPDDLDAATTDLLERVGGGTVTSPAGCFRAGLEGSGVAPGDYVLGVAAGSRGELNELVARSGREPIFRGEVVDTCQE